MPRVAVILLLTSYAMLAAFTVVSGDVGEGVAGRLIAADVLALGLVASAFLFSLKIRVLPNVGLYALFLGAMLLSLLFSERPKNGVIEYGIHVYSFVVGLAVFNLCANAKNFSLSDLLYAFFYASGVIAVLCLLQFLVFPSWFGGKEVGGLVGTFRNTGQAGTYFGTGLALFIPAIVTGVLKRSIFNYAVLGLIVLAIILTIKRAALLGLAVGFTGLLLTAAMSGSAEDRRRNAIFLMVAIFLIPIMMFMLDYAASSVDGLNDRFSSKISDFTVDGFINNFFGENLSGALRAFNDRPLLGVGPNNIIGEYTEEYEIHSTPFSILSATGLFGISVYVAFLIHWLMMVWRAGTGPLLENRFMRLVFPMLIGLVVSWGYTYHVRKREFWILYGCTLFCVFLLRKYQKRVAAM